MTLRIVPLAIIFLLFQQCSPKETQKDAAIRPVKYAHVEQVGGVIQKVYSGTTQSASKVNLSFRSNGLIVLQNAKVGQRVKKGMLLARLDQKDVKLAYEQAEADVQNAKAQYNVASSALARTKQLYESNNASLSDYEMAKSSFANARSALEISTKRLEMQASQISYTEIIAPMDGIISTVNSGVNEVVSPGSTIIVMSREGENDMEVLVGLPQRYISEISSGQEVMIKVNSQNESFSGTVTEVGYSSTNAAGTYPVVVSMNLADNTSIRPDMPAEVVFSFGSVDNSFSLRVPIKAVSNGPQGSFVYKLNATEGDTYKVQKVMVELGSIAENSYEIKSGLTEGDKVAIAGLNSLYEGRIVKLLTE